MLSPALPCPPLPCSTLLYPLYPPFTRPSLPSPFYPPLPSHVPYHTLPFTLPCPPLPFALPCLTSLHFTLPSPLQSPTLPYSPPLHFTIPSSLPTLPSLPLPFTLPYSALLHSILPFSPVTLLHSTILYHISPPYLLCTLLYPTMNPPLPYSTPLMSLHSTLPSPPLTFILHYPTLTTLPSPTPFYPPLPFTLPYLTTPFTLPYPTPLYPTIPCPTPLYPPLPPSQVLPFTVPYHAILHSIPFHYIVRVPHGWRMGSPNGIGCLHFFLHEYEEYHNTQCLCLQ